MTNLKQHIKYVHTSENNFTCGLCKYATPHRRHIKKHINYVHKRENNFSCEQCQYSTPFKRNLERHITGVHNEENKFNTNNLNMLHLSNAIWNDILNVFIHVRRIRNCDADNANMLRFKNSI